MDTLFFRNSATEEEHEYFKAFKKAIDEKDEVQINLLIRKEGFLRKYFHLDDGDARTFIAVAAERGTIKTVSEMCQLLPDVVNFTGLEYETPIFNAMKNSPEMVKFFIEKGADINARNNDSRTLLYCAIKHSEEVVKILLQNEASVDVMDNMICDVSLLHQALLNGTQETLRLLLNKMLSKLQNDYEEAETSEEIVRKLLLNKDDLKFVKKDIPLLIFFWAKVGNDSIFKMMLNEIREHFDLEQNDPENICRDPVELNIGGYYKRTALHYATRQQLPEVVQFLLKAGADVNCKTRTNFTPLHYAASLENEELCKILVSFGADVNYNASNLGSPLYQVCGRSGIRDHLVDDDEYYYKEHHDFRYCGRTFNLKIMKLLLESGAEPDIPAFTGNTPFLEACENGMLEPFEILLEFGADFNITNEFGYSALHFAVLGNSLEIVHFLLEKGLEINSQNDYFKTPLLLFMERGRPKSLEMVEYLVNHGADVNAGDAYNVTSLHLASIFFESMELVEGLLELGADWEIEHEKNLSWCSYLPNFGRGRKLLISFIALNEKILEDFINCYFEHKAEELLEAFEYFKKSRLEIEKLKSSKIVQGRTVSFYDFLTGSAYNTVQVIKNDEINNVFKSCKYSEEFPCYWFLLQRRFERIVALMEAVDKMADFLTNSLSPLPTLFIRQILNSLKPSDFKNFHASLSNCNRVKDQTLVA